MKNYPNSQHLTHKYPIWQGCTLGEIVLVTGLILGSALLLVLSLSVLFGHLALLLLGLIPVILVAPKRATLKLSQFKKNKPHGFVVISLRLWLEQVSGGYLKTPYVKRVGIWSTRQRIKR